jgi:hypothetical protein
MLKNPSKKSRRCSMTKRNTSLLVRGVEAGLTDNPDEDLSYTVESIGWLKGEAGWTWPGEVTISQGDDGLFFQVLSDAPGSGMIHFTMCPREFARLIERTYAKRRPGRNEPTAELKLALIMSSHKSHVEALKSSLRELNAMGATLGEYNPPLAKVIAEVREALGSRELRRMGEEVLND